MMIFAMTDGTKAKTGARGGSNVIKGTATKQRVKRTPTIGTTTGFVKNPIKLTV